MRAITLLLLALLTSLGACAVAATPENISRANVGEPPARDDAESQVKRWLDTYLKDPESARVTFGRIEKGAYADVFSPARFAWELSFTCNAKNSFGGYTGASPMSGFFLSGRLVAIWDGGAKAGRRLHEIGTGGRTAAEAGLK